MNLEQGQRLETIGEAYAAGRVTMRGTKRVVIPVEPTDLPHSVQDVLNGAADGRVQNRPWLKATR